MTRHYVFICDGCGAEQTLKAQGLPYCWADVEITVTGYTNWVAGGGRDQELKRLLCGSCQINLHTLVEPENWPRAEKPDA